MLKNYFLQLRMRFALHLDRHKRFNIAYQRARHFGVLFSIDNTTDYRAMEELTSLLQNDGKEVTVLVLVDSMKNSSRPAIPFDCFAWESLSYLGAINLPYVKKFVNTSFDYLFCVDRKSSPLIYYLLAKSKARCRVGEYKPKHHPFFEMMVYYSCSMSDFVNALYKYILQLR